LRLMSLGLENFRNLEGRPLEFSSPVSLFHGENAQGKTSLLEAIYFVGTTKSFREKRLGALVREGDRAAAVAARVRRGSVERNLEIRLEDGRKELLLDGEHVDVSTYLSVLPVVSLTADDRGLVKGEPKDRRDFLDGTAFLSKPAYLRTLLEFGRVLRQRNRLLQEYEATRRQELDVWTGTFLDLAAEMVRNRREAAARVQAALEHLSVELGTPRNVEIRYLPNGGENLKDTLDGLRSDELQRGHTLAGPHRDRVQLLLNGQSLATFGSSGQIRQALWMLKLAQVFVLQEREGEPPVFLLDDVDSELDAGRLAEMIRLTKGRAQIFLTSTRSLDEVWGPMERFQIRAGSAAIQDTETRV
jgi:DNA replication and repair protein RecF